MVSRRRTLAFALAIGGATLAGCSSKSSCNDIPFDQVVSSMNPATSAAFKRAQAAGGAKLCSNEDHADVAMVFNGSLGTVWKTVEDELLKEGWKRKQQDKPPAPDAIIFQVWYTHAKAAPDAPADPLLHLTLTMNAGCAYGDVCVRAAGEFTKSLP